MFLEGYGLILLTRISVLILLASFSVMIMLSNGALLVFLTVILVGMLTLIWSILMVECISKVSAYNGLNNLMG